MWLSEDLEVAVRDLAFVVQKAELLKMLGKEHLEVEVQEALPEASAAWVPHSVRTAIEAKKQNCYQLLVTFVAAEDVLGSFVEELPFAFALLSQQLNGSCHMTNQLAQEEQAALRTVASAAKASDEDPAVHQATDSGHQVDICHSSQGKAICHLVDLFPCPCADPSHRGQTSLSLVPDPSHDISLCFFHDHDRDLFLC